MVSGSSFLLEVSSTNLQKENVPGNLHQATKGTVALHDTGKYLLPGLLAKCLL